MRGRVTNYLDDKGFGFVKDENGENRFFHISNVVGMNDITKGSLVEFSPSKNEKGLICLKINVVKRTKSNFISVGNTNIKVSNIKEFGVSYSSNIKAIKTPIYERNQEYFDKKVAAGKNPLKHILLPKKIINTALYVEVPKSEFEIRRRKGGDYFSDYDEYVLPYVLIRITPTYNEKDYSRITIINENDVKFIYWKYLYITTYQNDNYQFYEDDIDIDETTDKLNELLN